MKTNKYLNIAASVLMLAACAKEELVPSEELIPFSESTTVTFVATDGTKTVLGDDFKTTSWDKKENVLLWEGETETPLTIGEDNKSYEGGILTITADVTSPESTFYSVIGPEGEDNVTRTSAAVLATQNPAQASFDPNAEILVAQPATCGEGNTVALKYNRPVAITVATLKNLEEGEKVLSVKITAAENLTGKVNFTYEGSSVKAAMGGTGNTITCNYTTNNTVVQGEKGEGYIFPVYFISLNAEVTVFEFEVCTDKHKYYRKITRPEGSPIILNDNRVAKFGFTLENADKADAEGDKFVKVTSTDELTDGEYLIVYETGNVALNGALTADQPENTVSVTISNNEITSTDAISAAVVTYDSSNGSLLGSGGKYVGHTGSKNTLDYSDSALENVITFDENGNAIITAGNYVMKFNNTSGQERFRYYGSGQQPVQLYKKTPGGYGKYTLATPAKIQYSAETQEITWDAVENAGKYTISLNGGESVECPSNEYDASTLAAEYYYATVVAFPSAEKESTYQASSAGTNEGWFKIGEPTMKKIEAKDIDVLAGARSLEITWPEQTLATNGYSSELWSVGEGREKLQEKTEIAPDATSITYDGLGPNTKYRIYLTVKGVTLNDDRGERVYGGCTTYKDPITAQLFKVSEITTAGSYAIENAVVVAKANDGFLVKDNFDENAGYIMVNKAADDLIVGDIVSVSGTVESFNSQLRFGGLSNYSKTGHNDSFVQPATADKYMGVFEYLKYVNIIGRMTSSSGWLVTDATGNNLKVFANDQTDANKYVSVTGYLTHTTASFAYLIATEIVEHTLTATPEELTWEANRTDIKYVTIGINEGVDWTFAPTDNIVWNLSKDGNTLSVQPVSANTSINKKELTVTLTHATNTQLTKEIKLSQNGKEAVYEKVTSVNDLSVGDEIVITSSDGEQVMGEQRSNNVGAVGTTPVVPNYSTIKLPSSVLKLTLVEGTKSGQYAFIWKDGETTKYLYAASSSSNYLRSQNTNDDNGSWSITIDNNGTASIVAQGTNTHNILQYNSGSTIFACYGSASQSAVAIYKIDNTTSRNLQFSANADTKDIKDGKNVSALALTGNTEGGITYSSTNKAVATIDSNTGAITLVSAGSTTIKANAPKTATLKAGEASYTLTVTDTRVKEKLSLPTGLSSGTPTSNGTTLSWTSVTNAGSYKVEYKESGESNWTSTVVAIASCELTGLKASTTYSWKVIAIPLDTETYSNSDAATGSDFTTTAGGGLTAGKSYSWSLSSSSKFSAWDTKTTVNNVGWTPIKTSVKGSPAVGSVDSNRGQQFGAASNNQMKTLTIKGTDYATYCNDNTAKGITNLKIALCAKSGNTVTPTAKVGTIALTPKTTSATINGSDASAVVTFEFTSETPLDGDIEFTISVSSAGAIYVKSIGINN